MYEASLNAFDLILLDTDTPPLEGLEAVEVLRKLEEFSARQTTILGIGSGNETERERCGKGGYDSVIARPVTGDTIGEMLSLIEL
jgi:CheY-like chemotaxis protein